MPVKEAEAANSLIDQGVDVLTMHVDSPKVIVETAEQRGVFVTGYHANQAALAPKGYLTGAEWNWGKVYTDYVDDGAGGQDLPAPAARRPQGRLRQVSPYGEAVSADAKKKADAAKAKFMDGTLVIYKGPLKDNTGKVVIAGGHRAEADRHRAREDGLPGRRRRREDALIADHGSRRELGATPLDRSVALTSGTSAPRVRGRSRTRRVGGDPARGRIDRRPGRGDRAALLLFGVFVASPAATRSRSIARCSAARSGPGSRSRTRCSGRRR